MLWVAFPGAEAPGYPHAAPPGRMMTRRWGAMRGRRLSRQGHLTMGRRFNAGTSTLINIIFVPEGRVT